MADKEADLKIVVSTEADKKSSAKTVRELEESIYSSLKSGYIEVPAKVKTHIEGASKEFKQAQDKLLKNWEATFGKGFSASGANFESFSKDYSKFKRLAKGNYDTEQVKWITENIGKQVAAYKKAKTEFEKQIKTLDISSETNIKTKQSTSRKPRNFGTHTKEEINSNIQQENNRRYKGISSVTPKTFEDSSIDPGKTNEYEMRLSKYSSYGSNWARELSKILKEEYAKALQSLVTYIDKNYEIGTDNKLHGKKSGESTTEAQMIADVYRQVKRELTNSVIKSESGDESITASTFTNLAAIMKVLNKTLMTELSGKSLEDSIAKTATDIANAISKPYSISEKDAMGFTDLKEGEEKGVGPGHKRTQQILSELTNAMKEWDNEIFGKIESGISRVFSSQLSNKVSQIQLSDDYKNEISKLNGSMSETLNAIKAGTKLTDTQLAYDKIENVREATADSDEKRISKESKDINRDVARTVKSDAATGFNTDAKADELIQLVRNILQQIQGIAPKKQNETRTEQITENELQETKKEETQNTSSNPITDYSIETKKAWDTLKDSVNPKRAQMALVPIAGTFKNYYEGKDITKQQRRTKEIEKEREKQLKEASKTNKVEKSQIYASPFRQGPFKAFEDILMKLTGTAKKYEEVLSANAEDQDLMAANRIQIYGLNNGRNPNDTGDIAGMRRILQLYRTNKASIEQNPELMQKIQLTPGRVVDTTEITKELNKALSGRQMENAQNGGGFLKNFLGFATGGIGYAFMPSLEKSRAQADGLNQIMGNINKALQAVLINIQTKETELAGMEATGQAKFDKDGYLTSDSSSAAFKTLADLEEEKLVLDSIKADLLANDEIIKKTGGRFSQIVKHLNFTSPVLKENNGILRNINSGLDKNGKALKFQTRSAEILNYAYQLMSRSIGQMLKNWIVQLNPITQIKKLFQDFMSYDTKWQRTMNVIKYNLRDIVRPFMEWIAQKLVDIIGFIDIISMKIQEAFGYTPISLFDQKNADEFKKTYEEISSVSAGFDELHDIGSTSSENDPENLLGEIYKPQLSQAWIDLASEIGDLFAGIITGDLGFSEAMLKILDIAWKGVKTLWNEILWPFIKNTIWPAIKDNWLEILAWILGAFVAWKGLKLIGSLLVNAFTGGLKGIVSWISQKLFGKTLFSSATTAGATAGGLFSKALYTGMSGSVVTVGKLLGGIALTATGAIGAVSISKNAGENWQDLSTSMKVASVAGTGLMSVVAGLGAVLMGASGPVGWAVAGVTALTALTVGLAQTQDGIGSVKEETEALAEAQATAETANQNYLISLDNLAATTSNLEQLERQTGISGEELAKQIKNGTLTVNDMTTAQLQVYNAYLKNEEMIKQLKETTRQKEEVDKQAVLQSLKVEAANAIEADSYDTLREKVVQAWEDGSISAEEAGDILSRTLANASDETQATFGESIPEDIREAFNPDKYESGWRKFGNSFKSAMKGIGDWFTRQWQGIQSWWNDLWDDNNLPKEFEVNISSNDSWKETKGKKRIVSSMAVGTNYVPNDGLAYLHQGEAVIPKKYNQPYQPASMSPQEQAYMQQMMNTMRSLDNTMKQGITVNGQFVQRGSDLVAVVNKTKSQTGADLLSNVSYAR